MKLQLKNLSEQVIVLTGASSGIGLATARKAARQGAKLVLVARNEDALRQICDELRAQGGDAIHVAADVASEQELRQVATTAVERYGRIDTWMNVAGVGIFGKTEQISITDMRRLFDVNLWGVVHGSLAALPHLKTHGGTLINMGSETSDRAVPLQGIYSASKHAVKGFTDALRMELEEEGAPVSVTLVKPASIDTMFVEHSKNYMEVEPQLPPPVYTPDVVADALLYAARYPVRDLFIGSRARMSSSGAHHTPRLLDRAMERFMYRFIKTDIPAGDREHNSLHHYQKDASERGTAKARGFSVYTSAVTHPNATRAVMLGTGLALAAMWQARRRQRASLDQPPAVALQPQAGW